MSELSTTNKQELAFKQMSEKVKLVLSSNVNSIENSLVVANAIGYLRESLTPEIMAPIMSLQGSKLGFKTDRDLVKDRNTGKYIKGPGYPIEVVKDCFIEMSLIGLLPTGNMWNIIAGNPYITKEGGTFLLKNMVHGLKFSISYEDVKQSSDKLTANVTAIIKWEINGEKRQETVPFPIKSDPFTTFDSLIGKADRKAKVWLYNQVSGLDISDGDVEDIPHVEIKPSLNPNKTANEKEIKRVLTHVENSKNIEELERCSIKISKDNKETLEPYLFKYIELADTMEQIQKIEALVPDDNLDIIVLLDDKKRALTPKK
jgi:hypothetical protein